MNLVTKIACKTLGTAAIGVALYDATLACKHFAKVGGENANSRYLEKAYFDSRTTDTFSPSENILREKTFNIRATNPLPMLWGKIKGGFQGAMYGLGNNITPVVCGALALAGKGLWAKLGAIGVTISAVIEIARNGYSFGKNNPMN